MPKTFTLGQTRVRVDFNPSANPLVNDIKEKTAFLIDTLEELKSVSPDPRACSVAQTAYEEAAMWAVKAATA